MKILAVDTTTQTGSVALLDGEKVVAETILDIQVTHAEKLLPGLDDLFKKEGWSFDQLQGLAVSLGPGSFTGLRIGLATMKAFAQSLNLPLVGVSSLEALAYNAHESQKPVAAILDAKRKEVYAGIYQFSHGHISKILLEEQAIAPDLLCNTLKKIGPSLLIGDGAAALKELFPGEFGEKEKMQIRAGWVGRLALAKIKRGEGEDWRNLVPNYLRSSDAEIKK